MAITDYSSLKTAVQSYSARTDTIVNNEFDTFLENAEKHIYNGYGSSMESLRIQNMVTKTTLTATNGVAALPSDYLSMISIFDPTGLGKALEYQSPQEFTGFTTGKPIYYTIIGDNIELNPEYGGNIDIVYWAKYAALTSGSPTNYLLTNHSDLYLHSVLIETYSFLRDSEEESKSTQRYQSTVAALMSTEKKKRYSGNLSRPRAVGGFNGNADQQC